MASYDVIVIGLGGMGSSALYHLTKTGSKVLGLEQFTEAHGLGSSHGKTRLIRKAYFEHPDYVPLLQESYRLWGELEKVSQEKLLHKTGLTIFGAPESLILKGIRNSRDQHQLSVREYNSAEAQKLNSAFKLPQGFIGMGEDEGGFLEVEKCVSAYLKAAKKAGAEVRCETPCLDWGVEKDSVWVRTPNETIRAGKLIFTAGPWSSRLLRELQLKLSVHRVVQFWFQGKHPEILKRIQSCFAFDMPYGFFYGFPIFQKSRYLKVALHKPGDIVEDPSNIKREICPEDSKEVSRFLSQVMPEIDPIPVEASVCMYTMTPDEHFIIDTHPNHNQVILASGFSGHGFKFASVIGKILSDLADSAHSNDLKPFLKIRESVRSEN